MWNWIKENVKFSNFIYFLMYSSGVLMVGMIDFVTGEFKPDRVVSAEYWRGVGILAFASLMFLLANFNKKLKILIATNIEYNETNRALNKAAASPMTIHLEKFLNTYLNPRRKKHVYLEKMKKKLKRLDDGIWWIPFFFNGASTTDKIIYHGENEDLKESNRYCQKRKELEEVMTDEYIKKALPFMKIKYPAISKPFVTMGYESKSSLPWTSENKTWKMFKDLAPNYFFNTGFVAFISSFMLGPSPEAISLAVVLSTTVKLAVLLWNRYSGGEYAETYFEQKTKVDMQSRWEIYQEFNDWCKKEGLTNA